MNAYSFRLEKVLELRRRVEKEMAAKLARARKEAEKARQAMLALEAARNAGRDQLARAHGLGGSVGQLQNLQYVLDRLGDLVAEATTATEAAEENVSAALAAMNRARRERRILDRLRERDFESWLLDRLRAEQQILDETAIVRHGKARQENVHKEEASR